MAVVAGPGWTGWGLRFQAPTQSPAVPQSDHHVTGLSTESGSGAFPEQETEGGGPAVRRQTPYGSPPAAGACLVSGLYSSRQVGTPRWPLCLWPPSPGCSLCISPQAWLLLQLTSHFQSGLPCKALISLGYGSPWRLIWGLFTHWSAFPGHESPCGWGLVSADPPWPRTGAGTQ